MNRPELPKVLPGFESINRYWDSRHDNYLAKIHPGEFYVTNTNEGILTILGSCISACLWDEEHHIGGMNHFMLPLKGSVYDREDRGFQEGQAARFGNWAMEYLINQILKNGGKRRNLKAKVFGGARLIGGTSNIGEQNIKFILDYLHDENIELVTKNVGDIFPRHVIFFPINGKVQMKLVKDGERTQIVAQDNQYIRTMQKENPSDGNDVEFF